VEPGAENLPGKKIVGKKEEIRQGVRPDATYESHWKVLKRQNQRDCGYYLGRGTPSGSGTQEKLISAGQNKLNSIRQNELIMVQFQKLNMVIHEKLINVQRNKLTKARELWQVHMKN
jgi:hypothetical protein